MKFFKLLLFLTIFLSLSVAYLALKIPNKAIAQINCGKWKSQCCTGSFPPPCELGLTCQAGICESSSPPTTTGSTSSTTTSTGAIPDPGRIPCKETRNPEFNSDRPYQASPCGDANKALFCSNSVVVTIGSVHTKYTGPGYQPCRDKCSNDKPIQLIIDLTNVNVPVLGNTQQIKNSQSSTSSIDEATRLNEYVSSYLNGTNDQAETGQSDLNKVVDFSGPIKKLLPQQIQEAQRIATINTTTVQTVSAPDDKGQTQPEPTNHNQIVVCGKKEFSLPPWVTWLPDIFHLGSHGIGREIPTDCYPGDKSGTFGNVDVFRLSNVDTHDNNWSDSDTAQDIINWAAQNFSKIYSGNIVAQILAGAADRWPLKIPPLPWSDQNSKPFASDIAYQKAYNEWQGKLCAIINSHLFCLGAWPLINNPYADLFPYIPLANTTDKIAGQTINSVEIKSDGALFDSKGYDTVVPPKLFFGHTQESADLSSLLQKTFKTGGKKLIGPEALPSDVENNSTCQTVRSYSNPGDDATFTKPQSFLEVDGIKYTVGQIKCPDNVQGNEKCTIPGDPTSCKTVYPDCSADVTVTIPMQNKTPNLSEIWNNTVAGDSSIFRRIYPQTGATSPVSCIADIPGVSKVTYTSDVGPNIDRVIEPDGSGTGGGGPASKSIDAQYYFPHLGSISDYFLKGIQTALRPKGYAEPVISNECATGESPGFGQCTYSASEVEAAKKTAANKYGIPEALLQAVLEIEGAEWFLDAKSYVCKENEAHAAGLMQVTRSAYEYVTCPNERYAIDADSTGGICKSQSPKLSRCDVEDNFILAARTLLWKFGLTANCNATGPVPTDKISIYNATCKYYGTFSATPKTINYENGIPDSQKRSDGLHMNYCDIVCHKMGACPPYPVQ